MNPAFFQLGHTQNPTVLGFRLREFSLGHWLYLTEIDNPIITGSGGEPVKLSDFFIAVNICRQPYMEARTSIFGWWIPRMFQFWGWRCRNLNPAKEYKKFLKYIANGLSGPNVTHVKSSASSPMVSPSPCALLAFMCHLMNQSIGDAYDTPVQVALMLKASYLDLKGELGVWNEKSDALWEAAAELNRN